MLDSFQQKHNLMCLILHDIAQRSWHLDAWPHTWSYWMASATYKTSLALYMKILLNNFSIFAAIGFPEHFSVICKFQYRTDQGRIQIINKYQNWTHRSTPVLLC